MFSRAHGLDRAIKCLEAWGLRRGVARLSSRSGMLAMNGTAIASRDMATPEGAEVETTAFIVGSAADAEGMN